MPRSWRMLCSSSAMRMVFFGATSASLSVSRMDDLLTVLPGPGARRRRTGFLSSLSLAGAEDREPQLEGGPLPHLARDIDDAAVVAHDPLDDAEAEARALFLGGVERREDALELRLADA